MSRPVTLFSGQWSDLSLEELCKKVKSFGYDGIELATFNPDHLDVEQAASSKKYCDDKKKLLAKYGLKCYAISKHRAGQLVCDPNNDARSDGFAPKCCAGKAEAKRKWAVEQMKNSAKAAKGLGVKVVTGFTGSPIWHLLYSFPPVTPGSIDAGFKYFAKMFNPILDEYAKCGVKFALEVHPTEIAFDYWSTKRLFEKFNNRPTLGLNFDPSHLVWNMVNPAVFARDFADKIYHVHMKDVKLNLDGRAGILGSHLTFGDTRRGWNFVSLGHGNVDFDGIIRELNQMGYNGPLSVEWEDSGMDRIFGATEACEFTKKINFNPSDVAFDAALAVD